MLARNYGEAVTGVLMDVNIAIDRQYLTAPGLIFGIRCDPRFKEPVRNIDNAARRLFPHVNSKIHPNYYSSEAQATACGMIMALYLTERLGAAPNRVRSALRQRLDIDKSWSHYPNGGAEFLAIGHETLKDMDVIPEVIPKGQLAITEKATRHFAAGFGFVLSAAFEEFEMRDAA